MTTSNDQPHPLRPYYTRANVGSTRDSASSFSNKTSKSLPKSQSFGASARDLLSDLDYTEYIAEGSPSVPEVAKRLFDQALYSYTAVFLAQPFEAAKTVLQCYSSGSTVQSIGPSKTRLQHLSDEESDNEDDDDSEGDYPAYFTPTNSIETPRRGARKQSSQRPSHRRGLSSQSTEFVSNDGQSQPTQTASLDLQQPDALLEVVRQAWTKEGPFGVWKGTNTTFVHNFLMKTIENWVRSFLAALLNVPDPGTLRGVGVGVGGLDVVDSPSPLASITVIVAAASISAVVLSPLDLIRTRLILTATSRPPRTMIPALRTIPSVSATSQLAPITIAYSAIPRFISSTAPLFIRNCLRIDPFASPAAYSAFAFVASTMELFVKLPLETVLRRAQGTLLYNVEAPRIDAKHQNPDVASFKPIVPIGPYKGFVGTLWYIVREEGRVTAAVHAVNSRNIRPAQRIGPGNNLHGLYRGWRVNFWGLVGVWGAAILGGSRSEGEF